jgi:hypothetical protein
MRALSGQQTVCRSGGLKDREQRQASPMPSMIEKLKSRFASKMEFYHLDRRSQTDM